MANANGGIITYSIEVDSKGAVVGIKNAEKDMSAEAEKVGEKSGSSLSDKFKSSVKVGLAAAAAAAGAAVIKISKDIVSTFADYQQLTGGVETLFKSSSDMVIQNAQRAFQTAQLSANQYMETVTSFSASLLQGLSGDTKKAAEYADRAIVDMADNANKMGTDITMIQNAYQGFAKQNYTMLDNLKLGYGGTKTEMERLITDASKMTNVQKQMGITVDKNSMSFDNIVNAISVMQQHLGIAGTSSKEASETISGSINAMKASWSNLLAGIADGNQDVNALVKNFTETIKNVGKNLLPVIKTALSGVVEVIGELAPMIIEALPSLIDELVPPFLEATLKLIEACMQYLPQITMSVTQALIDALPILVNAIIELANFLTRPEHLSMILNAGVTLLLKLVDAIPDLIIALIDALPNIIDNIVNFLTDPQNIKLIIEAAVKLFLGIVEAVPRILGALFEAFGKIFSSLWEGIKRLFGEFAEHFGGFIGDIFKGAINGILGFIEGFINTPVRLLNGFITLINSAFGGIGVNIGMIPGVSLPRLASGGIVESTVGGRVIMAGEGGEDEWVVPESKMASLINQLNARGGGETVNIYVDGVFATSADERRKVANEIIDAYNQDKRRRFANA